MDFYLVLAKFSIIFLIFVQNSNGQDDNCGMAQPDPAKNCVSLRLPWQEAPIFFCQDKETFKIRNECRNRDAKFCHNSMSSRNDTLMLVTPWDCCPIMSYPMSCSNVKCMEMPLNRKCRPLDKNEMRDSAGDSSWMNFGSFSMGLDDCCPTWFCEDDGSPKDCHFKRLQPGCMTPPKDKMNCVGFHDSYGCCIKWQCDEDNPKPGYCPAQMIAMRFNNIKSGNNEGQVPADPAMMPSDSPAPAPAGASQMPMMMSSPPSMQMTTQTEAAKREKRESIFSLFMDKMLITCIGDSNCPDGQKCCSHDPFVYSDGRYLHRNTQPTYGYCIEPASM